jgi:hypothetical protein
LQEFFQQKQIPKQQQEEALNKLKSQKLIFLDQEGYIPKFDKSGKREFTVRFKAFEGHFADNLRISFNATEYEISSTLLLEFERAGLRKGYYSKKVKTSTESSSSNSDTEKEILHPDPSMPTCFNLQWTQEEPSYEQFTEWLDVLGFDLEQPFWLAIQDDNSVDVSKVPLKEGDVCEFVHYVDQEIEDVLEGIYSGAPLEEVCFDQTSQVTAAQAPQWLTQPSPWNGKSQLKSAILLGGKTYQVQDSLVKWVLKYQNFPDPEKRQAIEDAGELTNEYFENDRGQNQSYLKLPSLANTIRRPQSYLQ